MKVGCDVMCKPSCLDVCADSEYFADGVHLSATGMEVFCKELQEMVKVRPRRCTYLKKTLDCRGVLQGKDLVISDSTLCVVEKARCSMPRQKTCESMSGVSGERRRCGLPGRVLAGSHGSAGSGQGFRPGRLCKASLGPSAREGPHGCNSKTTTRTHAKHC